MTLFITEYSQSHRQAVQGGQGMTLMPTVAYSLSSAAAVALAAGTQFIGVNADAGSFLGIISTVSGILGSSTGPLSSTNSHHLPANVAREFFAVSTSMKLLGAST